VVYLKDNFMTGYSLKVSKNIMKIIYFRHGFEYMMIEEWS